MNITETIAGKAQARILNSILKTAFLSGKHDYAGKKDLSCEAPAKRGVRVCPLVGKRTQVQI
jgi:hypothetical protein